MIDFMILGLPRSGTTWAANWLTTDRTFCIHDPLNTIHYRLWDTSPRFPAGRVNGVACTGIRYWPAWVSAHPARKLILHRTVQDVRQSLRMISLDPDEYALDAAVLNGITGMHVHWEDLFDPERARVIWTHLTGGLPFDAARHRELVQMKVVQGDHWERDARLQVALSRELGMRR